MCFDEVTNYDLIMQTIYIFKTNGYNNPVQKLHNLLETADLLASPVIWGLPVGGVPEVFSLWSMDGRRTWPSSAVAGFFKAE